MYIRDVTESGQTAVRVGSEYAKSTRQTAVWVGLQSAHLKMLLPYGIFVNFARSVAKKFQIFQPRFQFLHFYSQIK